MWRCICTAGAAARLQKCYGHQGVHPKGTRTQIPPCFIDWSLLSCRTCKFAVKFHTVCMCRSHSAFKYLLVIAFSTWYYNTLCNIWLLHYCSTCRYRVLSLIQWRTQKIVFVMGVAYIRRESLKCLLPPPRPTRREWSVVSFCSGVRRGASAANDFGYFIRILCHLAYML